MDAPKRSDPLGKDITDHSNSSPRFYLGRWGIRTKTCSPNGTENRITTVVGTFGPAALPISEVILQPKLHHARRPDRRRDHAEAGRGADRCARGTEVRMIEEVVKLRPKVHV